MEVIRSSTIEPVNVDGRTIYAYFAKWDQEYLAKDPGQAPHYELIERDTFDVSPTLRALYEHDWKDGDLAWRENGHVEVVQDEIGLLGRVNMPETTLGNDLLAKAKRKQLGMSWGGTVLSYSNRNNVKHIKKAFLKEISFTSSPANKGTEIVAIRSLEDSSHWETENAVNNFYLLD